jgi:cellobiose-specific phosphotransferase system component IIB
MASIVLVCVAAVSGTFLANRLREHLPGVEIIVSTLAALPLVIGHAEAVVIAPQLAPQRDQVLAIAGDRPVLELPAEDYAPGRAEAAAAAVRATLDPTHERL